MSSPLGRVLAILQRALRSAERFDPYRLDRRDQALIDELRPLFEELNQRWFRLRVDGVANLQAGPALYVGNHNGGVMGPDLSCTLATLWRSRPAGAGPLYAMAHDFAMRHLSPVGRMLQAVGAMRAHPENAERVFAAGGSVLVYPGGDLEAFRHFRDRNRIVFGTRTGFVRVAQRAGVPIIPIVAHGAHRSALILHEGEWLARVTGLTALARLQRFPVALSLPWGIALGPMPYLPLPFAVRLRVLPPIACPAAADPATLRDQVTTTMQAALDGMVRDGA